MILRDDRQLLHQMLWSDFNFFVAYFFKVVRPEVPFDNTWYVRHFAMRCSRC